jgi:hypothetical protein
MSVVDRAPHTLLIGGAPAVGKSTAARAALAAIGRGAIVEVDGLRSAQARCDWRDRRQHAIAIDVAVSCAGAFVRNGVQPVLILDTFGRDRQRIMQRGLDDLGLSSISISLWCADSELARRSEFRGDPLYDCEQCRLLNCEIERRGRLDGTLVDTTQLTPTQVAMAIVGSSRWATNAVDGALGGNREASAFGDAPR